jgi:ABC-type multidrug transport system fused ATPase/permease subunit
MATMRGGMGMGMRAERSPRGQGTRAGAEPPKKKTDFRKAMPEIWRLVRPRKWLLLLGLALVAINRVAGLTLPWVSRPFVNLVLTKHESDKLIPLVVAVFVATAIQSVTSFLNTQLLSKAAQRMIADLRQEVQRHVGRLSVSFYDANRTGLLVSRIMSDVEGVRNLIGTGLVEFVGGLLTAVMAFVFLLHRSPRMTLIVFSVIGIFVFVLQYAFKTIRPIFRERAKITGEVTGRLTESLGGVRVVKGYHAEEREAGVFRGGVLRLLDNVMKTLTMTSVMSMTASTTVLGIVGAIVMLLSGHLALHNQMDDGTYIQYTMFLAFMIAPGDPGCEYRHPTHRSRGRHRSYNGTPLREGRVRGPGARQVGLIEIVGAVRFDNVEFAYSPEKPVLHGISFRAEPGTVTALVGSSGSGKSTIISLLCGFHTPSRRGACW